jgi:hypothetical protein
MALVDNDHTLYVADAKAELFSYDGMIVASFGINHLANEGVEEAAEVIDKFRVEMGIGTVAAADSLTIDTDS